MSERSATSRLFIARTRQVTSHSTYIFHQRTVQSKPLLRTERTSLKYLLGPDNMITTE
jgi:hypothetical protein